MPPTLADFPNELLVNVLCRLPKKDLLASCVTCRLISQLAAEFMFERVYFAMREAPIERLLNIAQHPVFSKTVTTLIYDCRLFSPRLACDKQAYQDEVDRTDDLRRQMLDSSDLDKSFLLYQDHYHQQGALIDGDCAFKKLTTALKLMPQISVVMLVKDFSWSSEVDGLHDWYESSSALEFGSSMVGPSSYWLPTVSRKYDGFPRLEGFFNGLIQADLRLTDLTLGTQHKSLAVQTCQIPHNMRDSWQLTVKKIRTLRLSLHFYKRIPFAQQNTPGRTARLAEGISNLRSLLSNTPALEDLTIHEFEDFNRHQLLGQTWPCLRKLRLSGTVLGKAGFWSLLLAHKENLQELLLDGIDNGSPNSWQNLKVLLSSQFKLRRFYCSTRSTFRGSRWYPLDLLQWVYDVIAPCSGYDVVADVDTGGTATVGLY